MKAKRQLGIVALAIAALIAPTANANGQGNPNPGILPPQAVFKGKTMSQWSVAWWQWVQGTQGAPQMFDATGEFAHVNNNGADGVFFLAKTWSGVPQVRHVVIPSGTPLFVPVMGIGWWEFPGEAVGLWGTFENFLASYPESDMHDLKIVIDGKPVAALEDGNHRYLHYFGADGFGGGEFPVVTAWNGWLIEYFGYEIAFILAPLSPGEHVIEMKGKSACCGGFESDVTYHLTVLPPKPIGPGAARR